MTKRQEEIEKASRERHLEKYNQEGFCPDFTAGAQWADKTMIEKACEWLLSNAHKYQMYDAIEDNEWYDKKQLILDFKQAMKE